MASVPSFRFFALPQKESGIKESGKIVTKKVTEASGKSDEKVTKESRKQEKVIELLLPPSFCGTLSFRSGGTCEHALVPVFHSGGKSERTLVPVFVPGEHAPKPPFWKPPFWFPPRFCVCVWQSRHQPQPQNGENSGNRKRWRQTGSRRSIEPEVLQSGFGVNFLFGPGEFYQNCRRISQRILMVNFSVKFSVFPVLQASP